MPPQTIEIIAGEGVQVDNWPLPRQFKVSDAEEILRNYPHKYWEIENLTVAAPDADLVGWYSIIPQSSHKEYILLSLMHLNDRILKSLTNKTYST